MSLIQSIFWGFGSQVIAPGYGFMLQNRGSGFVVEPGHPNDFAPAKRPFHTIIPAALLDGDDRWTAVFGVTGGQFQPQGHVQVVGNLLDHGMHPQRRRWTPPGAAGGGRHVSVEPPLAAAGGDVRPARGRGRRRGQLSGTRT